MSKEKSNTKDWAGAFAAYKPSKEAMMLNVSTFLTLILILVGVEIILAAFFNDSGKDSLSSIANLLMAPLFTVALYSGVFNKKVEPGNIIEKTKPYYLQLILLTVLTSIALGLSFVLFIIPFFFVMPRLLLAPYFLVHKKLEAVDALKMSWEKSKPHQGKVWGIIGASIVMALPALTIIGIPLSIYFIFMYSAATAVLFKYVTN